MSDQNRELKNMIKETDEVKLFGGNMDMDSNEGGDMALPVHGEGEPEGFLEDSTSESDEDAPLEEEEA